MKTLPMPKVYGAVTVGERGQIVIPAKIRKAFRIKRGDKLIVFAKLGGHIKLIPADQFSRFLEHATEMVDKIKRSTVR